MDNTICNLLSIVLNNKDDKIKVTDWSSVLKELSDQTIIALPFDYVKNFEIDSELFATYKQRVLFNVANYLKIVAIQSSVLEKLNEAGVKVVVLKGTSAAKYYPKPEYRTMGDIDILVNPNDFDKATSIIMSAGFSDVLEEDAYKRHVGFMSAQGIEIELHRYFSAVGTKEQREFLDSRLYSSLEFSEDNILPEVENGLVLIAHVAQHLKAGLGLRQIIDWMMYAKANLTDEFWQNEFSEPAKKCGFDKLAKVTTHLCKKYFGLDNAITWCDDADEDVVDSMMEYIMNQGNFGRKQENSERATATVLNNVRNPVALFKYLQAGGKRHWKLAGTNKFFGCFAWIYQIGHLIRMSIVRRVGVKKLLKSQKESQGIVSLMDELEIKEY